MPTEQRPLRIAILAVTQSTASTVYGMYDLLSGPGVEWNLVVNGTPGQPLTETQIVSLDGGGFRTPNQAWIQPDSDLASCGEPDLVCVPDLMSPPGEDISGLYEKEQDWLRACHARGATLAVACTGALLLAEAGLLDDCDSTIHWAYCDAVRSRYPRIRVHPERSLVAAGEGQRILMAGGGTSWLDLALLLIARFINTEEAMRMARLFLIDWHHVGQQPYAALSRPRHVGDAVVERCQLWAAQHYDHDSPVGEMAAVSGLSERAFTRRFRAAIGMSPLEYIHALRLEEAKQLLEARDDPVEAVAEQVGYQDSSYFSRLFKRKVGLTPAQYRKRFGALRRSLSAATL